MERPTEHQTNLLALGVSGLCIGVVLGLFLFGPFHIGVLDIGLVLADYPEGVSLYGITSSDAAVLNHGNALSEEGYTVNTEHHWGQNTTSFETRAGAYSPTGTTFYSSVRSANGQSEVFIDDALRFTRVTNITLNNSTAGYDSETQTLYTSSLLGDRPYVSNIQAKSGLQTTVLDTVYEIGEFEPRSTKISNGTRIYTFDVTAIDESKLRTNFTTIDSYSGGFSIDEDGVIRNAELHVSGKTTTGTTTERLNYTTNEPTIAAEPGWINTAENKTESPVEKGQHTVLATLEDDVLTVYNNGQKTIPEETDIFVSGDVTYTGRLNQSLSVGESSRYGFETKKNKLYTASGERGLSDVDEPIHPDSEVILRYDDIEVFKTGLRKADTIQTTVDVEWEEGVYGRVLSLTVTEGDTLPQGSQVIINSSDGLQLAGEISTEVQQGETITLKPNYLYPTLEITTNSQSPRQQPGGYQFPETSTLTVTAFGQTYIEAPLNHSGSDGLTTPPTAEIQVSQDTTGQDTIYTATVKNTSSDTVRLHYATTGSDETKTIDLQQGESVKIVGASNSTVGRAELIWNETVFIVPETNIFSALTDSNESSVLLSPEGSQHLSEED